MSVVGAAVVWGIAVGAALLVGAVAAAGLRLPSGVTALITAFGGGILLAAVALELLPEADERAGVWLTAAGLVAGMAVYLAADVWLTRDKTVEMMRRYGHAAAAGRPVRMQVDRAEASRGESIAAGLFVDGVPESIALGLTIAEGDISMTLLVGTLVGNVVEAYGATQPMLASGLTRRFAIGLLGAIGLALAGSTVLGATVLADASPSLVGTAQAVASGAILAVITVAIVPHVFSEVNRWVAVASVLGFVGGYLLS